MGENVDAMATDAAATAVDAAGIASLVDADRLWGRHLHMARIGAIPDNGVNRPAFSDEDIAARTLLLEWSHARSFSASVDAAGNLFIRRDGAMPELPPVLLGSHLDTQPRGGRFDGTFGVLAGLEVLECLETSQAVTRRAVEVVAWSNEEGTRFPPCTMGSLAYTGALALSGIAASRDEAGVRLDDALAHVLQSHAGLAARPLGTEVACYIEAHIEQGPVLERARCPIGAVTGIQGLRWFDIDVHGRTDHAGTTPMRLRKDAVRAAVQIIGALAKELDDPDDVTRFTVGRMVVTPNSRNSVASRVTFSIDLRHPDDARLEQLASSIRRFAAANANGCEVAITCTASEAPCTFHPELISAIESAARKLGLSCIRLPSGATHDALNMARKWPTGMVFVPCEGGISHNELEYARPEDLAAGARVLAATAAQWAAR
jgi:N-carbamoyl-L-amino-acid hydrolase